MGWLFDFTEWVWDLIQYSIDWSFETAFDYLGYIWEWCIGLLPEGWQNWLHANGFATELWDLAEGAQYFIPWKQCVGIWLSSLTIIGIIRFIRWILGILLGA